MGITIDDIEAKPTLATLRKNVAAIHISGKLTLLQRKLSNVLLLNAYDDLKTKRSHKIDAKTLTGMIGYNSHDVETLRASLKGLAETVAEWDMLNEEGKQEWGVSSLLSYAKLVDGICEYAYSPVLADKLYDPEIYALINLQIQKRFSSGHALTLYENCYRFIKTGSTGWWTIETFRRLMGVDDSSYYETFKFLNAKIIKPAVSEINKVSNIEITPEFRKEGRAVGYIRFKIKENAQSSMLDLDDGAGIRKGEVYERLRDLSVSDRLARSWIAEYGEDYVAEKIAYTIKRAGRIKGAKVQYLNAAIRDDYKEAAVEAAPQGRGEAEREAQLAEREEGLKQREARALRNEKLKAIQSYQAEQSPTRRAADKAAFLRRLDDELSRQDFERNGWDSALNYSDIIAFHEDLVPEIFEG